MQKRKATNKQKAYIQEYNEINYRRISFKLHRTIDADLLEHLEKQPNKNAYLKELIRADMEKGSE
jgi:hypothetical protein